MLSSTNKLSPKAQKGVLPIVSPMGDAQKEVLSSPARCLVPKYKKGWVLFLPTAYSYPHLPYCLPPVISQQSFEDSERNKKTTKEEDEEELPDPVNQLVTMFSRQAQMEQGPQEEDTLYMDYAVIMAK